MTNELYHHGIDGQKHGIRRFQNLDGSLTPAGRERYGVGPARDKSRWGIFRKKTSKKTSTSRNAKEEKKTYKPVSEMSNQEINDFWIVIDLRHGTKRLFQSYLKKTKAQLENFSKRVEMS